MKLFVTGGAGFIGANFILYWMKAHPDDIVVNFDALTYAGNLENLVEVEKNPNYIFVHGDICDKAAVGKAMEGVDIVVHFAAETHVDRSIMDPSVFVKTNVLGTHVLLEASLEHHIQRFHHISTDEVFGSLPLDPTKRFNEATPYDPRSPYSASKAGSDHLVRAYHETYGLPITISNCSNNYGPYMFPEKMIPLAITNVLEGKKIPVYGDGLYVRDWLFVEDHCRAIERILQDGKAGETYCVGGLGRNEEVNNLTVAKKIAQLLGKDETMIEFVKDRPGHDRRYAIDWTKMKNELDWTPQYSFDEGLEKTVQWYVSHKQWWQRVKNGEYQSYYKKQYGEL